MSDKTFDDWLTKYYPVSADNMSKASDEECIQHSILKWKGLANLKDYNLSLRNTTQSVINEDDDTLFRVTGDTCALCQKYYDDTMYEEDEEDAEEDVFCNGCPLAKSLGDACDEPQYGQVSLYDKSLVNPELIVKALEKLLEKSE